MRAFLFLAVLLPALVIAQDQEPEQPANNRDRIEALEKAVELLQDEVATLRRKLAEAEDYMRTRTYFAPPPES